MLLLLKITHGVSLSGTTALLLNDKIKYAAISVPVYYLINWHIKRRRYEGKEL